MDCGERYVPLVAQMGYRNIYIYIYIYRNNSVFDSLLPFISLRRFQQKRRLALSSFTWPVSSVAVFLTFVTDWSFT
jgi:hypothetical protein